MEVEPPCAASNRRGWRLQTDRGYLLATTVAAVGAVVSLWLAQRSPERTQLAGIPVVFFILPVLVIAFRFGVRGGLIGAIVMSGVSALDPDVSLSDLASHFLTFAFAGVAAGLFVGRTRRLVAELSSALEASRGLASALTVVTDSVADGLVMITERGEILRFNPAVEQMFGYAREEVVGRNVSVLMPEPDRSRHDGYVAAYVHTGEAKIVGRTARDTTAVRKDGSVFPIALTVGEATYHGERVFVAAIRDITERKLREGSQLRHEEILEEMVKSRTAELRERSEQLQEAHVEALRILALAAENRDDQTFQHAERVGETAARLAKLLGLSRAEQEMIRTAAPLHDIGKIGVPDSILNGRERLTLAERLLMQDHTTIGHNIASQSHSDEMQLVAEIALTHHEWWDGTGYPQGLRGDEIPLSGRIVAVADVYDALTHDRPYKSAWTVERAVAEILSRSGSQFDPAAAAAFSHLQPPTATRARAARLRV